MAFPQTCAGYSLASNPMQYRDCITEMTGRPHAMHISTFRAAQTHHLSLMTNCTPETSGFYSRDDARQCAEALTLLHQCNYSFAHDNINAWVTRHYQITLRDACVPLPAPEVPAMSSTSVERPVYSPDGCSLSSHRPKKFPVRIAPADDGWGAVWRGLANALQNTMRLR